MPRLPRTVFASLPHHITQRGNRREDIFFTDEDREAYLSWLREYSDKHQVEVLAYCLMTNHIHLIAVPATDDGLHQMLKPLHMRYAQRINLARGWKGHLWQGRFFHHPWMKHTCGRRCGMWNVIRFELGWNAAPRIIVGQVLLHIVATDQTDQTVC